MITLHPTLGPVLGSQGLKIPESFKSDLSKLDALVGGYAADHAAARDARAQGLRLDGATVDELTGGVRRGLESAASRVQKVALDFASRHRILADRAGANRPVDTLDLEPSKAIGRPVIHEDGSVTYESALENGSSFSARLGLLKIDVAMRHVVDLANRARGNGKDAKDAVADLSQIADEAFDVTRPNLIMGVALTHLDPSIQRQIQRHAMVDVPRRLREWRAASEPARFEALHAMEELASRLYGDAQSVGNALAKLIEPARLDRSVLDAALQPLTAIVNPKAA